MQKRVLPSLLSAAVLLAACSCPSSYKEVPSPGLVTSVAQVKGLTRCQVALYGTTLLGNAPNAEVVKALLERGAEPNGKVIIDGKEYRGSAFLLASHQSVIGALAEAGCNPDVQGGADNSTPLCRALRNRQSSLALTLLSAGANPNLMDGHGESPLYLAASALDLRVCQVLVNQGARVDVGRSSDGATPLMAALKAGGPQASVENKIALAEMLMNAGANHLQADAEGNMPMHYAPVELMPTLMASGASVNCTNSRGRTPLFYGGSRSRIDFLLQQGADINAKDMDGNTAFDTISDPSLKAYILSRGGRSGKAI